MQYILRLKAKVSILYLRWRCHGIKSFSSDFSRALYQIHKWWKYKKLWEMNFIFSLSWRSFGSQLISSLMKNNVFLAIFGNMTSKEIIGVQWWLDHFILNLSFVSEHVILSMSSIILLLIILIILVGSTVLLSEIFFNVNSLFSRNMKKSLRWKSIKYNNKC